MLTTTFGYAFIAGLLPSLLWLWFWLKEDIHPEPRKILFFVFLGGMIAVPLVIPFQKIVSQHFTDRSTTYLLWAAIEELMKFAAAYFFALRTKALDEPVDAIIYMITVALGFAALENTFFLFDPLSAGNMLRSIVTGNLRFIGATLLHVVSSASIGIFISLSLFKDKTTRYVYLICGILVAIALHTTFNLFIISTKGSDTFMIFACVWMAVVFLMLMFEKVKNIPVPTEQSLFNN